MNEQAMKAALDGNFFYIDGQCRVVKRDVPKDHIPDHRPLWGPYEDDDGPHHNALPFTLEQEDAIIDMRAAGMAWRHVAKAIGRCAHSTREHYATICRERGITPANVLVIKSKYSPEVKRQIVEMREARFPYDVIASRVGLSVKETQSAYQNHRKAVRRAAGEND